MLASKDHPFGILAYHRVSPHVQGIAAPTWNVTPDRLGRQLSGLMSRGHRPWPLRRAIEARRAREPVPDHTFVVTFDDGYDNIYENALPVLRELSVPATVFVTTAYLDGRHPFAFDDWAAAGSDAVPEVAWKPLSEAHCSEMIDSGLIEIGSHTHTHANLRGRPEMFRRDLMHSVEVLGKRFGLSDPTFAFPYGYYGAEMIEAARETGVKCALTTDSEIIKPGAEPFSWGRFVVDEHDSVASLLLKLNGWYSVLWRLWQRLRPQKLKMS